MEKSERDAILRQGVVLPETPRRRRELAALAEDLGSITLAGKPLPVRARHFRPSAEAYLVATRGPLPYMLRLREIEQRTAVVEESLREAWEALARECEDDADRFRRAWMARAEAWRFDELNDLVERHNLWYPVESRLPMDPRRGDYVLVNGRDYRLEPLDARWVLERFPPDLSAARQFATRESPSAKTPEARLLRSRDRGDRPALPAEPAARGFASTNPRARQDP